MAYRDDRQALAMQLAELERENERLKQALSHSEHRARDLTNATHEARRLASRTGCSLCGGTLLPVAVFAGHDISSPLPLSISTIRFGSPTGGFTHSAPVRSLACASCGYIHNFIDMAAAVPGPLGPGLTVSPLTFSEPPLDQQDEVDEADEVDDVDDDTGT